MNATDHLKWIIGDMAFQLANLNAKVEELETQIQSTSKADVAFVAKADGNKTEG